MGTPDMVGELLGEQWISMQNLAHSISAIRGVQKSLPGERVRKVSLLQEGDKSVEGRSFDRKTEDRRGVVPESEGREHVDGIAGGVAFIPAGKPGASTGIWVDPNTEPVVFTVGLSLIHI